MSADSGKGPDQRRSRSGISPETLVIAAVASVAAAFLIAQVWGPGTLFGAAAAPVIVALISAALQRPVEAVRGAADRHPEAVGGSPDAVAPTVRSRMAGRHDDRPGGRPDPRWGRWRWALITGLVGFVIAVGIITVPDLVAGHSITGDGRPTTFFSAAPKIDAVKTVPAQSPSTTSKSATQAARTVTVTTSDTTTNPTTTTPTVAQATTTVTVASSPSTASTVTVTPAVSTGGISTATIDPTTAPSSATP